MDIIKELYNRIEGLQLWRKTIELKRNDFLKSAGTTDTNLYYVVEGSLKASIITDETEHIIRFGYQHDFIASLDSFITESASDLFIQAIKKSTLKVISKNDYMDFVHDNTENRELWETTLQLLIVQQMERERDLLTNSPKERYERVLKRSPRLFQEIPNKHIASYLRMTPETLSRLKKS